MRRRALVSLIAGVAAIAGFVLAGAAAPAQSASPSLSIMISGNHFINGAGHTVQLIGADVPSTEYACVDHYGYSDGDGPALAAQIAAWGINAVRIPLNEDCWLGINGEPNYGTVSGYQQAIEDFVSDLNADGIYAILDLHWSAPGENVADAQQPMPDQHSLNFWSSVASTFKSNQAVIFDAFNEPFSPAANGDGNDVVSWSCWLQGGCTVPLINDDGSASTTTSYTAVGMQQLVDAIRATNARQPIMVGGLQWSEDLSGWLANEPVDDSEGLPQIAASFHNYEGDGVCDDSSCWDSTVAPVAAKVPVVTGEFAQDECPTGADDFDDAYMDWADQHGVSYLAWEWDVGVTPDCSDYYLVNADGSPASPNGVALYDHLQALTTTGGLTSTTVSTTTGPNLNPPNAKPKPKSCVVPKVTGDALAKARRRLKAADCRVGKITRPKNPKQLVVASTKPKAGRHERFEYRVAIRLRNRRRRA